LVIITVILAVIVVDFLNNRPDRRGINPYALEVDQYREVDAGLISHRETRNLALGSLHGAAIGYHDDQLYLAGDSLLLILKTDGSRVGGFSIPPGPSCLLVEPERIYVGYPASVSVFDHGGTLLAEWADLEERTVITNLAGDGEQVYVADAGNRRVLIYGPDGMRIGEFEGKSESDLGHGFIVPSPSFDLTVDPFGELWVVNPGMHALENYSREGRLRGYWQNSSFEIEGFLGCCNPARITVLDNGWFVTSEKGMVRIKIYDPSGQLQSVVAPPDLFREEGKAPDICAGPDRVIYALDFDRNSVRIFEPLDNG
jgi:hypothetical protein